MSGIDLDKLNPAQLVALKQTDGAVMVMAGAGSGKTRVTTYRVAYLIREMGVDPQNILAITFTNKATNEMKERLLGLLGETARDIWISTFHSMCVKILRSHISNLKNADGSSNFDSNFSIYTDSDRDKALKTVIKNLKVDDGLFSQASYHISHAKNFHLSPWEYQKENVDVTNIDEITTIYSAYQKYLAENNALDFDDLLFKTYDLFLKFPNVLEKYQNKFMYIHVDEFQDTNKIQYLIVKALAGKYKNIFVVGDEDQCIYSWRGASISNVLDFKRDFPECKILKLEQNYRSTKLILSLANLLIRNNSARIDKTLWTENSVGERIDYYVSRDEFDEAEYVAMKIRDLVRDYNYKYSDFAILTRLNAMTAPFEEKFLNYNIPYKVYAGKKFFERLEIKNILAYLKMITNPYDMTSFERIVNFPKRGIGEATVKTILDLASFHGVSPYTIILSDDEYLVDSAIVRKIQPFKVIVENLLSLYDELTPLNFIKEMIKIAGFYEAYSSNSEEDIARLNNIDSFLLIASEYFETNKHDTISDFLQSITLTSDIDEYDDKDNAVSIATVHAVKGLEFKVVFIVGLEERMFPIVRAYSNSSDMEEERRLMFVAITRARERLFLTRSKSRFMYGKREYMMPSRFLTECNIEESAKAHESPREYVKNTSSFSSFAKQRFNLGDKLNTKEDVDLAKKYAVGTRVSHPKFGEGKITANTGIALTKCVTIDFEGFGQKTLSVEYAPIKIIN